MVPFVVEQSSGDVGVGLEEDVVVGVLGAVFVEAGAEELQLGQQNS